MRDSTIIYRSFYEAIKELPSINQAEVWGAVFEYSLNFKVTELTGLSKTIFTLIKPQIDANIQRFKSGKIAKKKRTRSESEAKHKQNGSETGAKAKRTRSKSEANNNVNVNNNENENGNENNNLPFGTPEFLAAWNSFLLSRKETKKKITDAAIELIFADLREWGEQKSIVALKNSVKQGWQGVFEPKQQDMATASKSTPNEFSKFAGYNATKHNDTDNYTFRISPGGAAIDYFRK